MFLALDTKLYLLLTANKCTDTWYLRTEQQQARHSTEDSYEAFRLIAAAKRNVSWLAQ